MLCRLAAAYAYIREMLLVERDTSAFYTACNFFDFFFTGCIAAPHSLDKAGLVLGCVNELIKCCCRECLFLSVFKSTVIHIVVDCNHKVSTNGTSSSIETNAFSRVSRRTTTHWFFSISLGPISTLTGTPFISYSANFQPGAWSEESSFTLNFSASAF